ncbi:hypothetical protein BpHYR1_015318 [Brachionus plicatilis]|uniref:Uncharacterized protein n=1 Tax=Brachionus plicatilis TaxID=10195 RepID=A0A3M7QCY6_BRAPC|nr:hypothetical protein BpHYR1_015318 [Brachionus plicatilis]
MEYYEVNLDIFLIPSSLSDEVHDFKVLIDDDMLSNNFPIQAFISVEHTITTKKRTKKLNNQRFTSEQPSNLYYDESLCFDKQIKEKLTHNTLASLYNSLYNKNPA